MVQMITYDLNKEKNYSRLYEAIKSLGDWARDPDLDSVWFVQTPLSLNQASDILRLETDADDRLFITKLERGSYAGWLHKDLWPWIEVRL